MKATAIGALAESPEKYYPHLHLSGDEIETYLGNFTFEKDKRYSVELEFTVDGWHKDPDGKESVDLCIKSGSGAQEVGEAEEPKPPKKEKEEAEPKAKVAKVIVKAEPVEESY